MKYKGSYLVYDLSLRQLKNALRVFLDLDPSENIVFEIKTNRNHYEVLWLTSSAQRDIAIHYYLIGCEVGKKGR